jgi:hypothetical protein
MQMSYTDNFVSTVLNFLQKNKVKKWYYHIIVRNLVKQIIFYMYL